MTSFTPIPGRDAWFVIRGYMYQAELTILRWIGLTEAQRLELECGEDIDIVSPLIASPNDVPRELEQVKRLDRPISLRTPACVKAIVNAADHLHRHETLLFRFCTNARPAVERLSPFLDQPAIEVWEDLRNGRRRLTKRSGDVRNLRELLKRSQRPEGIRNAAWGRFRRLLDQDNPAFVALVRRFEWSTGIPADETLRERACDLLAAQGLVESAAVGWDIYPRLFLRVFKALSKRGPKRLSRADLVTALGEGTLSANDQALLGVLTARIGLFEHRLSTLEQRVAAQGGLLEGLARSRPFSDTPVQLVRSLIPPDIRPPRAQGGASRRTKTLAQVQAHLEETTWLAVTGGVGSGKTQLAALLAESLMERPCVWIPLRGLDPDSAYLRIAAVLSQGDDDFVPVNAAALVDRYVSNAGPGAYIFLDDLPSVEPCNDLLLLVRVIAATCLEISSKLVTTSYHPIPPSLAQSLPPGCLHELPAPPFLPEETNDILLAQGCPSGALSPKQVRFLTSLVQGHATLVSALARLLRDNEWAFSDKVVTQVVTGRHRTFLTDRTAGKLLDTVEDGNARRLLYRLSLVAGDFDTQGAVELASVFEALPHPRELLARLSGLWIQPHRGGRMSVSPLVASFGESELVAEERKDVFRALAGGVLRLSKVSVVDVTTAVAYFVAAEDYDRAGTFLVQAFLDAKSLPDEQLKYLYARSWTNRSLPIEMSPMVRVILRAVQIPVGHRLGMPLMPLIDEADSLACDLPATEEWVRVSYYLQSCTYLAAHDLGRALEYVAHALAVYPSIQAGERSASLPTDVPLGELVWLVGSEIKSPQDLGQWLAMVSGLAASQVAEAFQTEYLESACEHVINAVWMHQHEQAPESRDWAAVLKAFDQVAVVAASRGWKVLWENAIRGSIIVQAEYLGDLSEALATGERALVGGEVSVRSEFLIRFTMGQQAVFKRRFDIAEEHLGFAVGASIDSYPGWQYRARLLRAQAVVNQDSNLATRMVDEALPLAEVSEKKGELFATSRVLGEQAIAHWREGRRRDALAALEDVTQRLLTARTDTPLWRRLWVHVGHVLGYYYSVASTGRPPEATADGEPYVEPFQGMFSADHVPAEQFYQPGREALLFEMLAGLAEELQDLTSALTWALRSLEAARKHNLLIATSTAGLRVLPFLAREHRIAELIDVALEACAAMVALKECRDRGEDTLSVRRSAVEVLGARPGPLWDSAEAQACLHSVVPALMELGNAIARRDVSSRDANELMEALSAVAEEASLPELWRTSLTIVEGVVSSTATAAELENLGLAAGEKGHGVVHLLGLLAAAVHPEASLARTAVHQVTILPELAREYGTDDGLWGRVVVPCILQFWGERLSESRFLFRWPDALRAALDGAHGRARATALQEAMLSVLDSLDVDRPPRESKAGRWIYSRRQGE